MITHIYVARLRPDTPADRVRSWLAELATLRIEGMSSLVSGADLGLREGNDDVAIVAEFQDSDAWRRYDVDEHHNRIRAEHARPIVESQQRVQFESGGQSVAGSVRNVTLISFKAEADLGLAARTASELGGLKIPGMLRLAAGADLGLQAGNASLGVVCDFEDAAAYRAYDADEPHNRIRREIAPSVAGVRRVQFGPGARPA
jgi:hypothetical protein